MCTHRNSSDASMLACHLLPHPPAERASREENVSQLTLVKDPVTDPVRSSHRSSHRSSRRSNQIQSDPVSEAASQSASRRIYQQRQQPTAQAAAASSNLWRLFSAVALPAKPVAARNSLRRQPPPHGIPWLGKLLLVSPPRIQHVYILTTWSGLSAMDVWTVCTTACAPLGNLIAANERLAVCSRHYHLLQPTSSHSFCTTSGNLRQHNNARLLT